MLLVKPHTGLSVTVTPMSAVSPQFVDRAVEANGLAKGGAISVAHLGDTDAGDDDKGHLRLAIPCADMDTLRFQRGSARERIRISQTLPDRQPNWKPDIPFVANDIDRPMSFDLTV